MCRGKDFREYFKRIGGIRALVDVPFMALTASAPPEVQADITNTLHLRSPITVSCSLDRPNVFISASRITSLSVSSSCLSVHHNSFRVPIERFAWIVCLFKESFQHSQDYFVCSHQEHSLQSLSFPKSSICYEAVCWSVPCRSHPLNKTFDVHGVF